jgi:hypothetical protein
VPSEYEVTEEMRLEAINNLMKWQTDPTVRELTRVVLKAHEQPAIGHLARFCPDDFDDLYEEASGLVRNDQ